MLRKINRPVLFTLRCARKQNSNPNFVLPHMDESRCYERAFPNSNMFDKDYTENMNVPNMIMEKLTDDEIRIRVFKMISEFEKVIKIVCLFQEYFKG